MNGSFAVSEKTLANLCRHLSDALNQPVTLAARFVNARTITTPDLSALLNDSSVVNHKIEMLRVSCGGFSDENQANITLGLVESRPVLIELKGDRKTVLSLEESIKNELGGVNSPLWILNSNQWIKLKLDLNIALGLLLVGILIPLALQSFGIWSIPSVSPLVILILAVAPILFSSLGPIFSPSMVFDFGKGHAVDSRRKSLLKLVFGSIVLATALGLVVNWISARYIPPA